MKKTKTLIIGALVLALGALSAATLIAKPGPHRGGPFGALDDGPFGEIVMERLADRLELSEEQRTELRAIREIYRPELQQIGETMAVARRQVADQIRAETFDESAIRAASERAAAVHADFAVLRGRMHSEMLEVLTPDQIEEARALREKWQAFANEWRGERRWGRAGGGLWTEGD